MFEHAIRSALVLSLLTGIATTLGCDDNDDEHDVSSTITISSSSSSQSSSSSTSATSSQTDELVTAGECPDLAAVINLPEMPYRVLAESPWGSPVKLEPTQVIQDQAALEALFGKLADSGSTQAIETPVVDFTQKTVLVSAVHNANTCGIERESFTVRRGLMGPHLDATFHDESLACTMACALYAGGWIVVEVDRSSTPSICTRTRPGC